MLKNRKGCLQKQSFFIYTFMDQNYVLYGVRLINL